MDKKLKTLPQTVTIKRNESAPESMELVAESILELAEAVKRLRIRAKDKLICLLLSDMTGQSKRSIQQVIDAIPEIAVTYLRDGGRGVGK